MKRFLLVLCLAGFASSISWRMSDPMLPVMADDLGVSIGSVVLLSTAYALPYALMQCVFGPAGDAYGKVTMIRLSLGVVAVSLAFTALAPSYGYVFAGRVVGGIFGGGLTPMSLALMGDSVALEERQVAIGRYLVAAIFGQVFGAAAAGFLVEFIPWRVVFGLAAVVVAACCVATVFFLDGTGERHSRLTLYGALADYRTVLSHPAAPYIFVTVALEGAVILGLLPLVAVMVQDHGADGSFEAGIVLAAFAIGGMGYGIVVRSLVRHLGQWNMMRVGGTIVGLSLMATALPVHWIFVAGCFAVIGFGFYMLHNTIQTRATELAPRSRGSAIALLATCYFIGQGGGPALDTVLIRFVSFGTLFFCAGLIAVAMGFVSAALVSRHV